MVFKSWLRSMWAKTTKRTRREWICVLTRRGICRLISGASTCSWGSAGQESGSPSGALIFKPRNCTVSSRWTTTTGNTEIFSSTWWRSMKMSSWKMPMPKPSSTRSTKPRVSIRKKWRISLRTRRRISSRSWGEPFQLRVKSSTGSAPKLSCNELTCTHPSVIPKFELFLHLAFFIQANCAHSPISPSHINSQHSN